MEFLCRPRRGRGIYTCRRPVTTRARDGRRRPAPEAADDDLPATTSAPNLLKPAAPDLLAHGGSGDPPGVHPWGPTEIRPRPCPWEPAPAEIQYVAAFMGANAPVRGHTHGVGAPVPRPRAGLRLAVRGRIHGIWGAAVLCGREGGEQGSGGSGSTGEGGWNGGEG
jgi:hypothetical protein